MQKGKVYCRRCHELGDEGELLERLRTYIDGIDEAIRCEEDAYKKRLRVCDQCENMVNGMCGYCGCFVIVRAAKHHMTCPNPTKNLWEQL